MLKQFKFRGKKYILDVDRLLFNTVMLVLMIIIVVGFIYVSNSEYELLTK